MHFLPDVYVPCDVCHGRRYNRETLEILYKGKNITEVLDLTVEDAHAFFSAVPSIARKLQTLLDVGLGYIRLGQSATTLSGGEAQRVKLALELSQARHRPHALHPRRADHRPALRRHRRCCCDVLHQLRDAGNTIVVIEHNLDVIKTADWLDRHGPRRRRRRRARWSPPARRKQVAARPGEPHRALSGAAAGCPVCAGLRA